MLISMKAYVNINLADSLIIDFPTNDDIVTL